MRTCARALEHRQLPFGARFIEAKDVEASIIAPDLDVAVVGAVPLIERFENVDLMPTEMKSPGHGHSAMVSMLLCLGALQNCQVQCRCQVNGRIFYFLHPSDPFFGVRVERGVLGSVPGGQNGRNQKDS